MYEGIEQEEKKKNKINNFLLLIKWNFVFFCFYDFFFFFSFFLVLIWFVWKKNSFFFFFLFTFFLNDIFFLDLCTFFLFLKKEWWCHIVSFSFFPRITERFFFSFLKKQKTQIKNAHTQKILNKKREQRTKKRTKKGAIISATRHTYTLHSFHPPIKKIHT